MGVIVSMLTTSLTSGCSCSTVLARIVLLQAWVCPCFCCGIAMIAHRRGLMQSCSVLQQPAIKSARAVARMCRVLPAGAAANSDAAA